MQGTYSHLEWRHPETNCGEGQGRKFRSALSVARRDTRRSSVGRSTRSCVKQPCGLVRVVRVESTCPPTEGKTPGDLRPGERMGAPPTGRQGARGYRVV